MICSITSSAVSALTIRAAESLEAGPSAHRVSFDLVSTVHDSDDPAMDRLMNGAYGIRARYGCSPEAGDVATQAACRVVAELLRSSSRIQLNA